MATPDQPSERKKPMTAAERQRNYRERLKQCPEKYEERRKVRQMKRNAKKQVENGATSKRLVIVREKPAVCSSVDGNRATVKEEPQEIMCDVPSFGRRKRNKKDRSRVLPRNQQLEKEQGNNLHGHIGTDEYKPHEKGGTSEGFVTASRECQQALVTNPMIKQECHFELKGNDGSFHDTVGRENVTQGVVDNDEQLQTSLPSSYILPSEEDSGIYADSSREDKEPGRAMTPAERQRKYRERLKKSPEKWEEYKRREAERRRVVNGQPRMLTGEELAQLRMKERQRKREYRQKLKTERSQNAENLSILLQNGNQMYLQQGLCSGMNSQIVLVPVNVVAPSNFVIPHTDNTFLQSNGDERNRTKKVRKRRKEKRTYYERRVRLNQEQLERHRQQSALRTKKYRARQKLKQMEMNNTTFNEDNLTNEEAFEQAWKRVSEVSEVDQSIAGKRRNFEIGIEKQESPFESNFTIDGASDQAPRKLLLLDTNREEERVNASKGQRFEIGTEIPELVTVSGNRGNNNKKGGNKRKETRTYYERRVRMTPEQLEKQRQQSALRTRQFRARQKLKRMGKQNLADNLTNEVTASLPVDDVDERRRRQAAIRTRNYRARKKLKELAMAQPRIEEQEQDVDLPKIISVRSLCRMRGTGMESNPGSSSVGCNEAPLVNPDMSELPFSASNSMTSSIDFNAQNFVNTNVEEFDKSIEGKFNTEMSTNLSHLPVLQAPDNFVQDYEQHLEHGGIVVESHTKRRKRSNPPSPAAMKQRKYREKLKQNPERFSEYKEKELQRYLARKACMTQEQVEKNRKQSVIRTRRYRTKQKLKKQTDTDVEDADLEIKIEDEEGFMEGNEWDESLYDAEGSTEGRRPLSQNDRRKRYIARMRSFPDRYEEFKKKEAERKKESRQRRTQEQIERNRELDKERQRRHRARKRAAMTGRSASPHSSNKKSLGEGASAVTETAFDFDSQCLATTGEILKVQGHRNLLAANTLGRWKVPSVPKHMENKQGVGNSKRGKNTKRNSGNRGTYKQASRENDHLGPQEDLEQGMTVSSAGNIPVFVKPLGVQDGLPRAAHSSSEVTEVIPCDPPETTFDWNDFALFHSNPVQEEVEPLGNVEDNRPLIEGSGVVPVSGSARRKAFCPTKHDKACQNPNNTSCLPDASMEDPISGGSVS